MELAEQAGLKTGVVTTARITDATPAATYAHSADRTWENDQKVPQAAKLDGCTDIADQLVNFSHGDGIDLILGGGRSSFHSTTTTDIEYPQLVGLRRDGRDLVNEWINSGDNRHFVWNRTQLLETPMRGQIFGLFEPAELHYEIERPTDTGDEPSLAEMAQYAVKFLSESADGFFLVIEGARIDHGNHNKEPFLALTDTIEFSNAVREVLRFVDLSETTVLVTADHSSALAFSGYPTRGMPVLGSLSYPEISFSGGSKFQAGHLEKTQSQNPVSSEDDLAKHAGEDVPAYATGYKARLIKGVMEQNELFGVILESLGI
jgi:alkaline phosphatase